MDFQTLAISSPQPIPFVFGDGLGGTLEGHPHHGGVYVLKGRRVLLGWESAMGDSLDRTKGQMTLFPWGVRTDFGHELREEWVLHKGKTAISIHLHSHRPVPFTLRPILPESAIPLAVSADRPFRQEEGLIRCLHPETDWTVHLAFADSLPKAQQLADHLCQGEAIHQHRESIRQLLERCEIQTSDPHYDRALHWAILAGDALVVSHPEKGIWAGLPWFRDHWGRDTFIALPGILLVTGRFEEAKEVIRTFARRQNEEGRIPNRVTEKEVSYNTADGTPWMIRAIAETLRYTGDPAFAKEMWPVLERAIEGEWSRHGDSWGFFTHEDADTWMDARIEGNLPWSARGNRAIEVQALWYTALREGVEIARWLGKDAPAWEERADRLSANFPRFFNPETGRFADRLRIDGTRDEKVRPNQLLALTPISPPLLPPEQEALILRNAIGNLLLPHGIVSLAPEDPYFHPLHEDWEHYHKDAAYHNGTVWGWNTGFATSALVRFGYLDLAARLARNLARQILDIGHRGTMSELVDAITLHPSGTFSQAWSVSEFVRNAIQDFVGFRPDLLKKEIELAPAWPWKEVHGRFPFGKGAFFLDADADQLRCSFEGKASLTLSLVQTVEHQKYRFRLPLAPRERKRIRFTGPGRLEVDGHPREGVVAFPSFRGLIGDLDFRDIPRYDWPSVREKDYLKGLIEGGEFR